MTCSTPRAGVVSSATGAITFSKPHNLQTNDRIVYNCEGGTGIGGVPALGLAGLTCGGTYYVYRLNDFTLRLGTSSFSLDSAGQLTTRYDFTPSSISGNTINVSSTTGLLSNGTALVYHAPAVGAFNTQFADVSISSGGSVVRASDGSISHSNTNIIYLPNNASGEIQISHDSDCVDGSDVTKCTLVRASFTRGGLVAGHTYYVRPVQVFIIPTAADFFGVRLYDSGGSHNQIDVSNVDGSQTLTIVGQEAIGGLIDGNMYYVTNAGSGSFQLKNAAGSIVPLTSCLIGTCSGGTHSLVFEGIATTVAGTGTQRFVLDVQTGGGGKLIGIGGPGALVGKVGDQIVGATSTGLSIGAINVHDAEADVTSAPTVRTTICGTGGGTDCGGVTTGSILRARDIHVTSATNANAATSSSTEGGGFIELGSSEANATVTNDATTTVGAGALLTSTRDVSILATTIEKLGVDSTEAGGAFLFAGADANPNAFTSHHTNVVVDGEVDAVRTVLAEARDGFVGIVNGRADAGGIGTDSEANDNDRGNGSGGQGLHIGTHGQTMAVSQTSVGGTIKAQLIFLAGNVGRADTVNADGTVGIDPGIVLPGCQNGVSFCLNAVTFASSHATALGADSDATAIVDLNDLVAVHLGGSASLIGDSIELHARHDNVNLETHGHASCSCGGGDTDATARVDETTDSRVSADLNSSLKTSGLLVDTFRDPAPVIRDHNSDGGFLDDGDSDATGSQTPNRTIWWQATVYLLGEPNPEFVIDGNGFVVAKTRNVTAHTTCDADLQVGDTVTCGGNLHPTVSIDPIIYDQKPNALFMANAISGVDSTIDKKGGVFFIQETWDYVTITSNYDVPLQLLGDLNGVFINTLNKYVNVTPEAVINVSENHGTANDASGCTDSTASGHSCWEFDVKHVFPATVVTIQSLSTVAKTGYDISVQGSILNVIGSTSIKNDRGSIVAVAGTHTSNQLFLDSDLGSVGSLANPFNVILVQYARGPPASPTPEYPVVLHAEVGVDIFLNLTMVRRDSLSSAQGTAIAPVIGPVFAGHDIWININDSNEGIVPLVVHDGEVNRFVPNNVSAFDDGNTVITASGPIQEHVGTIDHFRPNVGSTPIVLDGAAVLIAYAADSTPINADYQFCGVNGGGSPDCTVAGVTAGHTIDIHHTSTATSVTFRVLSNDDATFTDADRPTLVLGSADNNGRIDLKTNGSIIDTETNGDLRVGQIQSTGSCTSSPPCNFATAAAWLVNPALAEHAALRPLGDVTLNSPAAVLDAESDGGVRGTDPTITDVIGQNITISADDNRLGLGTSKSGRGGVGTPGDFLEIQVNADAAVLGTIGTLTVDDDTAAMTPWSMTGASPSIPNAAGTNNLGAGSGTYGVFLTQTTGTMQINVVRTHGDASLAALAGSIRDARGGGTGDNTTFVPNVRANNIDLQAIGGSIGDAGDPDAVGNDLKIDSSNLTVGRVSAQASNSIFVTESVATNAATPSRALNLIFAQAQNSGVNDGIRITVIDSSAHGEDLNLIWPSDTPAPAQNNGKVLVVENTPQPMAHGLVDAANGWVDLRAGDNITLGGAAAPISKSAGHACGTTCPDSWLDPTTRGDTVGNTQVLAAKWIDVYGDYHGAGADPDAGFGSIMHLHGTITPGPLTGTPSTGCAAEINPGRDCNVTRIFGNTDADTITFDQTFLGGRTVAFGSNAPSCAAHDATCLGVDAPRPPSPTWDSEDFFVVNGLQTTFDPTQAGDVFGGDVRTAHSLTLDGQGGTDTYVINTTGSQACLDPNQIAGQYCHNYVINVLDTGAPDDGSDVLIVNGVDNTTCSGYADAQHTIQCPTDDIFLLRASQYIASTPTSVTANQVADDPAFVALLHGNFGTSTPILTGTFKLC